MSRIKNNLHNLVDEYIQTKNLLHSFSGYFLSGNKFDEKFCVDFSKHLEKYKTLGFQIRSQSEKEETIIATFELLRVLNPDLDELGVIDLLEKEMEIG